MRAAARAALPPRSPRRTRPASRAAHRLPHSDRRAAPRASPPRRAVRPAATSSATVSVAISVVHFSRTRTASCCFANHSRCCDCFRRASRSRYSVATRACVVEALELVAQFQADVLDARQVLARIRQAPFGLLAPLLVLGHAGGFLEEDAQLLGLGLDDARDHPLLDDRVGARPEARAEEQVVDVAAADRNVVDVVRGVAVARQHALDRDLRVLAPLAADATLARCRSAVRPTRDPPACARRRR